MATRLISTSKVALKSALTERFSQLPRATADVQSRDCLGMQMVRKCSNEPRAGDDSKCASSK